MTRHSIAPDLRLATAGGDDLDAVMGIMQQAFDPAFGEAWTRAQCAGILPMSGVAMTLARDSDHPVGFTLSRSVADEAELLLIAVLPTARGKGVASALLRHFILASADKGVHRLHLEVREDNPAVAVYARHSFRVHGRRAKYYKCIDGQYIDALTMGRTIEQY
jgi:[ribosomal protein S18]-alanine N-acetyltransferase